jgi:hypothetical protein
MINVNKFIPELFLKLTSKTYPHGYEDICLEEMVSLGYLPKDISKDTHGNYFYKIGESRTIFASHLDTVSSKHEPVKHVLDGETIRTDGTTTLGADDKAGVSIMIWMMKHKIPGTYYFFIGEEVGCIGSGLAAKYGEFKGIYDRIISFDRRGTTSIITHQSWARCCSDAFADAFCAELNKSDYKLNYVKDDGGVYTDSAEFVDLIPECTNVSVGYYSEHTKNENQDIRHLVNLASACLLVDWENLPTKRNPAVYEGKTYKSTYSSGYSTSSYPSNWTDYGTSYGSSWSRNGSTKREKNRDYDYYSNWEDQDDVMVRNGGGRTRRAGKKSKKGKTYFDNGDNLVEISVGNDKQYDWLLTKYNGIRLKDEELDIIKEQYLDVENNEYDRFFYECLVEQMLD